MVHRDALFEARGAFSSPKSIMGNIRRSGEDKVVHGDLHPLNPLTGTLKPHSSGPLYSNTVIGTLAVDGWAVTFGTARRGLGGLGPRPVLSSLYQM